MSRANQITENVIRQLKLQGCESWRNNTMGVFDGTAAAKKIWNVVQSGRVTLGEIKKAIQSSYRKSHERLGVSDVLGFTRHGVFVACEVKADKDILSYEQEVFLSDVAKKGGIAFIVAEHPEKIKLRVIGSSKITICTDVDFLRLFRLRLEEPF
jgi:VRR-NUC domain